MPFGNWVVDAIPQEQLNLRRMAKAGIVLHERLQAL
jgi:hypothetical protein